MASGRWQEKSGQWPAKQAEASGDVRKAPNEPNWNRPLIACAERVNVDVFGPVYAERTQFQDDMSEHTLPAAVGVVNPDLKRKQPWALA